MTAMQPSPHRTPSILKQLQRLVACWIAGCCVSVIACPSSILAQDDSSAPAIEESEQPDPQPGELVEVTLYRNQALVTRRVEVAASEREQEVYVGRLPEQVVADSVFAEGDSAVDVRGVRVRRTAGNQSNSREVQRLRDAQRENQRETAENQQRMESIQKRRNYIDNLMQFTSNSKDIDVNRGLLDAEALEKLVDFGMSAQSRLASEQFELTQRLKELEQKAADLQEQLQLLTRSVQAVHEATVIVSTPEQAGGSVRLSYLVSGCSWSPQYTLRGALGSDRFDLRYTGLVQQMSGEDWRDVKLTLSTASPNISAAGPVLTPFRVGTSTPANGPAKTGQVQGPAGDPFSGPRRGGGAAGAGSGSYGAAGGYGGDVAGPQSAQQLQQESRSLRRKQSEVANQYAGAQSGSDNLNRDLALNSVANEFQSLELKAEASQIKTLADDATEEVSSQSYEIAQAVSLASRREQHSVLIADAELGGELYHVATPLLSSFAYREADIINDREFGLLGGQATVYLDGRFVGRTEFPSIAAGQHLIVGFGADQQVRTRRELLDKQDDIQGGNRRLTFNYRLVVANFKDQPVALRMMDRMPIAVRGADVSIQYDASSPELSDDGLYRRIQRPRGILRWDLEVPADRFGEDAFDLDYSYSLEFDRTLNLGTAVQSDSPQMQQDLLEFSAPSSGMGGMGGGLFRPQP